MGWAPARTSGDGRGLPQCEGQGGDFPETGEEADRLLR